MNFQVRYELLKLKKKNKKKNKIGDKEQDGW